MTLFSSMENDFDEALNMARKAVMICQKQKTRKPMVYNIIY